MITRTSMGKIAFSFFGMIVLVAATCSAAGAAEPVKIEVGWFSAPSESVEWLQQEIIAFQASHPDVEVTVKNLDTPLRQRFQTHDRFFGKNPEDALAANVTGIDGQWGYLAPYLAERGLIVPLEKFDQPNDGFDLKDFYPRLLDQVRFQGQTWGVPWLAWDCVLVIDTELFEKASIHDAPRTWDEFLEAATALTRDTNGDGQIDQWGLGYRTSDEGLPDLLLTLLTQQGGHFTRDGKFDSSDPAIAGSIRFLSNFVGNRSISKEDSRSLDDRLADRSVRYAMHLEPNHTLGNAVENNRLSLVPIPSFDGQPKNFGIHRLYFSVRKSTEPQELASWEFVKWMTRADITLPNVFAGFPLRKDLTSRQDYRTRVDGKIQNSELIFTSCEYGYFAADRVVDLAPAMERFWQIIVPSFSDSAAVPLALARAQDAADAYLGDWYPNP